MRDAGVRRRCSGHSAAATGCCWTRSPRPPAPRCGCGTTVRGAGRAAARLAADAGCRRTAPERARRRRGRARRARARGAPGCWPRWPPAPRAAAAEIELASSVVVALAYRAADVATLPPTSGALIAAGEPLAVKGVTHSSTKWAAPAPGRAGAAAGLAGPVRRGRDPAGATTPSWSPGCAPTWPR